MIVETDMAVVELVWGEEARFAFEVPANMQGNAKVLSELVRAENRLEAGIMVGGLLNELSLVYHQLGRVVEPRLSHSECGGGTMIYLRLLGEVKS